MLPFFAEDFGNASSSTHVYGWRAEAAVGLARERIADAIGASDPSEIVFTSGTTESDNLAVIGFARANRRRGNHIVTVATEHPAVLDACRQLEVEGFEYDAETTTFFVGSNDLVITPAAGMTRWRKRLYAFLSRNALDATQTYRVPVRRMVSLGARVKL